MHHTIEAPIRFRHMIHNTSWPRTYAFRRPWGSEWVEVAAAYCSPRDQFSRRIGRELATKRFQEGHTMIMPWTLFRNQANLCDNPF
jgi:hypothetical protein